MHKLLEYVCDEMEELEEKVAREQKLSSAEMQYLDTLAHTKKNLLKAEEMSGEESYSGYSRGERYMPYDGSYGYSRRRYSNGRYSRNNDMM